ncbi:hypothetical protein P153DRAFT_319525 [Dothidotthia symphoricarpi CBS 119687]|uniref:RING-type domain-containing protein n=1 Tax=Dothidotthia symphoricarpi CBS 119687 TaxID=1392245 RepID=A0A6A6AAR2_9PLEO|nr:uncharacterized protein P153DRAFT_319525 [Dothidotthia symphoricarpi CBS 119687]KAF2128174.1 hypothetical protein P153DRAFT_319525 [Dothidotthia symphoricarpi CBS 119687]
MTAQRIGVNTIQFPDPTQIDYSNNNYATLASSIAFSYTIASNIQTLSTKGAENAAQVRGILYVPDLLTDACKESEKQHVPANATRLANLPTGQNYALMAFAPWYDAQCMAEYFASSRRLDTNAFLVYQPGENNALPPVLNDASWNLNDGGRWQSANQFPTYALSSMTGNVIMDQLNLYSGNLTTVPNGDELATYFDSTDYVRLWGVIRIDQVGSNLPSLWVFLVIVLAILIVAVGVTSCCMHFIQRRRRNALRQRVIDGQVDLEALGVKRLTVPQKTLDKLPTYTYTDGARPDPEKTPPQIPAPALMDPGSPVHAETGQKQSPVIGSPSAHPTPPSGTSAALSQTTCAICIDDFEPNESQVRELPCRHIFHPECIDTFLLRNSSLCPLCKQSVLPAGVCPITITNAMVRRERYISSMRARSEQAANPQPDGGQPTTGAYQQPGSLVGRLRGALPARRIFSAPARTSSRPPDIEMATASTRHVSATLPAQTQPTGMSPATAPTPPNPLECTPVQNRREWARQRAMAMLGNRHVPTDVDDEEERAPPWRRAARKVFPGFR